MKKVLSLVLALMLLLGMVPAVAENLYKNEIQFADFTFGMTFAQVREMEWVGKIEFSRKPLPSRIVIDAAYERVGMLYEDLPNAGHFFAEIESRKVAGHEVNVRMYFVYPDEARVDENAIFYAGYYEFWNGDGDAIFNELETKLGKLYGEPYAKGSDAEALFGSIVLEGDDNEWRYEEWKNGVEDYMPVNYVVWKSAANGAMLVLRNCTKYGDRRRAEIVYVWPEADQYFDAMQVQVQNGDIVDDDLSGL